MKIATGSLFETVLLSGLATIVAIAIIILILYIIVKVITPMLRFDTREYIVEKPAEDVKGRLPELLRFRGLRVLSEDSKMVVDDVFELHIAVKGEDSRCRIIYYAQAKTWLILVIAILLIVSAPVGALAALLAYLRYDDMRKSFEAAVSELGGKRLL